MLKNQLIKILFAVNLVSLGAQAGILDKIQQCSCRRGNTTVQTTAYEQAIWLGETASYAQAVGTLDVVLGAERFTIGTGTAIAPNLVLATAHGYRNFQSGLFHLNGVEYEIDKISFCSAMDSGVFQAQIMADDLAIVHLKSPVALESFPVLATECVSTLFSRVRTPGNQWVEGWCVSGGYITENLNPDHEEIRRHVTFAKLYSSHPRYPHIYYSKFKTAQAMKQTPYTGGNAYARLPAYEVDRNEHLLAGPLMPGDSGTPVFIAVRSGGQVTYKLTAIGSQIDWQDCQGNSCWDAKKRVFKRNQEFQNIFASIAYNREWLRKILKQYNAEVYQPELFELKRA